MKYKCIIFDCDGVLVDSETATIGVLVQIAGAVGLVLELNEALDLFAGQSLQYCWDYINKNAIEKLADDVTQVFREKTYKAYQTGLLPIPNVKNLLEQINVPCCVASNGPLDKIKLNLELVNLIDHFDGNLFSAYQIQKWKPLPDLFLHAAQKVGFDPKDCAVIEDSLAGVQAATAGGFDVYAYSNPKTAPRLKEAGAVIFDDMNKLYELL